MPRLLKKLRFYGEALIKTKPKKPSEDGNQYLFITLIHNYWYSTGTPYWIILNPLPKRFFETQLHQIELIQQKNKLMFTATSCPKYKKI